MLTGEGSDELFGGYVRYHWNELNLRYLNRYQKLVPAAIRRKLRAGIANTRLLSGDIRRKISHSFLGRAEAVESLYLDNFYSAFDADEQSRLCKTAGGGAYDSYLSYWNAKAGASPLRRMLYADQKTYLVELLMKQDQMSMSCSIESRVPFLDHTFVEFAMQVPDRLKIRNGVQKYILKEAVSDLLPHSIIHRKKMGFPTPLTTWLREPRAEPLFATVLERDGFLADYLDMNLVREMIDRHRSGSHDMTDRIWRLLNLQVWADMFLTGRRERLLDQFAAVQPVSKSRE